MCHKKKSGEIATWPAQTGHEPCPEISAGKLARATPAELARIPRIRAEFRPWRPLAFELQRRGYAARGWVLPGSSASVLHGRWPSCGVAEKARSASRASPHMSHMSRRDGLRGWAYKTRTRKCRRKLSL